MPNLSNEIEEAYRYCENITRRHAKSFYFAAKFLPKPKQKAVYPIYAFCRHIDDEIDEIGEGNESDAIRAVEKWQRKLEEVFEVNEQKAKGTGKNQDQKPKTKNQNLVLTAWQDLLETYKIPQNRRVFFHIS